MTRIPAKSRLERFSANPTVRRTGVRAAPFRRSVGPHDYARKLVVWQDYGLKKDRMPILPKNSR